MAITNDTTRHLEINNRIPGTVKINKQLTFKYTITIK